METLEINIKERSRSYPIHIGKNILDKLNELVQLKNYSKIFILSDINLQKMLLPELLKKLPKETVSLALPPGEKEKTIESITTIWAAMHEAYLDRKSLMINLGGGVITDMGGFAASTYMRGINFINIPTTLLSQVDASVGGKTGIDFAEVKNSIGTFSQPSAVIIDVATLSTLPKREFVAGFAEILKHGLIIDNAYFEKVASKHPSEFTQEELIGIIKRSCEIKSAVVQQDEKESGKRKLLNFGHTIGHAIEALSLTTDKPLLHGEAISIGMVAESEIAKQVGILSENETKKITETLANADLPITTTGMTKTDILAKMQTDKKNSFGKINFTLLDGIGDAKYNQKVADEIIIKAIERILI